ncbi:unnamed protein product [Spirodela intermedia]|uniref:Bidirectional sugar transporter SWEET n=1 Tax=Spirodela intermedia TaxID=51605 RepID=A0A7I8ITS3_SPIIN|nr:unnamed protein product [Spirodela intermedia]CAA6660364.1 unnamed protein product [Spirodela intermedia]
MDVFHALHFLFGIFGNATGLFLFLAPCEVTFRRIIRNKSTEQFSGIPYNMTLLNCLLSAWYGLPFVSPNNMLVYTINGTGAVLETVYRAKARMLGLLLLVVSVFATVALVSVLALHGQKRKLFCGCAATIFSICMYASPLSVMRLVIRTRSVEFMPFLLSLFVFLCGTSWFVFGLLGRDPFIAVPNGFGCGLGAMQLVLYAIYRNSEASRGQKDGNGGKDGGALEMGYEKPRLANGGAQNGAGGAAP